MSVISRPLLQVFRFHSEASPSANFGRALDSLITVNNSSMAAAPGARVMHDYFLRSMTDNLETAASGELGLLPAADRVVVASALHAAGLLLLRDRRSASIGERVAELMRASADFCLFVKDRKGRGETVSPAELFFYDRLIAGTTMSLKGLLDDSCLEPEQRSSLGDVLARAGILSGVSRWPDVGMPLPNLVGALWTHFGLQEEHLRSAQLLFPGSYFLSNTVWRREPLGDFEYILSKCLEGSSLDTAKSLSARAVSLHARDPLSGATTARFDGRLRKAPDAMSQRPRLLSDLAAIALTAADDSFVHLPGFLLTALASRH
ncbi:MAG TPA: hypothetical protein VFX30_12195 [bacterium]|nr:hypothetical protein [bacterium]